jgi:pimeloyl-ACP methyl ester carboxylesterase
VPAKYFTVGTVATLVHHRGPTTLPGHPPAAAAGATVLCIHDVAGNGKVFTGVLDALADTHRPISFDLPAHGRSGGLDSLGSIAAMAEHSKQLADALELAAPVLLGDGLGAAVALEAAATWPDWPAAVVVCGAGFALRPPDQEAIDDVRAVTAGRARRQFDAAGFAPDTPREVYERWFAEWMKTDPRATVGDLEALAAWDGAARLGAITAPVVAVVGEHEDEAGRDAAAQLAGAVADGRVVTLAGAGRRGVLEQPAELARLVADAATGVAA